MCRKRPGVIPLQNIAVILRSIGPQITELKGGRTPSPDDLPEGLRFAAASTPPGELMLTKTVFPATEVEAVLHCGELLPK